MVRFAAKIMAVLLGLALCAACDGVIADPSAEGAGPGGDGDGPGRRTEPVSCDTPQPGRSPLRRLTRYELDNTLRDLLGDDTRPAARLMTEELGAGFSNNADVRTVSTLHAEQYLTLAEDVSQRATEDMVGLLGCDPAVDGEGPCALSWFQEFSERAWRRPLTSEEGDRFVELFDAAAPRWGFRTAIELVLQVLLQSPHFLYRVELAPADAAPGEVVRIDGYQAATRLSYLLWATMPDDVLWAAAEAGELESPENVAAHARRMLDDPRAEPVIQRFFDEWLQLRELEHMEKNTELHPDYRPELAELFRQETHAFVREVFENENADLRELLTADWTMANAELAAFYGASGPAGEGFGRVALDGSQRAGLLTQAAFLAMNAKPEETSPTHRGMFVRAGLLCGDVPPPPPGVDPIAPDPDPSMTMRERLNEHRADPVCASCHDLMDPLGFGFEAFDAVGQWRDTEAGRPVDDSGELHDTDVDGEFDGAVDLAHRLAESDQVQGCMARQWFRYAHGRNEHDLEDNCSVDQLTEAFQGADLDIRELIVALTQTDAFLYRRVEDAE